MGGVNLLLLNRLGTVCLVFLLFWIFLSLGRRLLSVCRMLPGETLPAVLFSISTGMGLFATLILLLGTLGWLETWYAALFVIMITAAADLQGASRLIAELWRKVINICYTVTPFEKFLIGSTLLVILLSVIYAFAPPLDYDSLEYHVAVPKSYFLEGRIHFIPNNVFASFPFAIEMLSYFFMVLTGDALWGVTMGKFANIFLAVLTGLTIYHWSARHMGRTSGMLGMTFFLTTPWTAILMMMCYTEMGLAFHSLLALYAFYRWYDLQKSGDDMEPPGQGRGPNRRVGLRPWLLLAALTAGCGASCKYTVLLFLHVPLGLFLLGHILARRRKKGIRVLLVFTILSLAGISPWLIRNAAYTGNPFYPLFYPLFSRSEKLNSIWSPAQEAKFRAAHGPGSRKLLDFPWEVLKYLTWLDLFKSLEEWQDFMSPVFQVFLPLALFYGLKSIGFTLNQKIPDASLGGGSRNRVPPHGILKGKGAAGLNTWGSTPRAPPFPIVLLPAYIFIYFFLWYFTHRIDRFLFALIPCFAVLATLGFSSLKNKLNPRLLNGLAGTLILPALFMIAVIHWSAEGFAVAIGVESPQEYVDFKTRSLKYSSKAISYINERLPQSSRVMLIGEAQVFYLNRPVLYATVFDKHPLEIAARGVTTPVALHERLRQMEITHIYINEPEIERLQNTYRYKFEGQNRNGYLEGLDYDLFRRYRKDYLEKIVEFGGHVGKPPPFLIYRLR